MNNVASIKIAKGLIQRKKQQMKQAPRGSKIRIKLKNEIAILGYIIVRYESEIKIKILKKQFMKYKNRPQPNTLILLDTKKKILNLQHKIKRCTTIIDDFMTPTPIKEWKYESYLR